MANVELLERVMTYIKDHPEKHDQSLWLNGTYTKVVNGKVSDWCATAGCFAGWTVLLSGLYSEAEIYEQWCSTDFCADIPGIAEEVLQISYDDREILFFGTNTRDSLDLMVKDIANGDRLKDKWEFTGRTALAPKYERVK